MPLPSPKALLLAAPVPHRLIDSQTMEKLLTIRQQRWSPLRVRVRPRHRSPSLIKRTGHQCAPYKTSQDNQEVKDRSLLLHDRHRKPPLLFVFLLAIEVPPPKEQQT